MRQLLSVLPSRRLNQRIGDLTSGASWIPLAFRRSRWTSVRKILLPDDNGVNRQNAPSLFVGLADQLTSFRYPFIDPGIAPARPKEIPHVRDRSVRQFCVSLDARRVKSVLGSDANAPNFGQIVDRTFNRCIVRSACNVRTGSPVPGAVGKKLRQ